MPTAPAHTNTVRLAHRGDGIAAWDRDGDALPFVLIHGNSCSKEAFRPLFESTALARHRLVALDLPGCGESADARAPQETYNLPGLAEAVVAVVNALGLTRYALVGWSLGGHVAIEALLHGAEPAGLVLTGTPPCGPDPAEIAATFLPVAGSEVMSMEHPSAAQIAAFLEIVYAPSLPNAAQAAAAARADGRLRRHFFEYVFANPHLEPQRVTVARWPRPIALVQGRQEVFFDPAKLDALRWGNLWRGGTQWIENAGHAPFVSQTEAYAQVLRAFAGEMEADS
ncbi:MAG: alpha/beta hydrolase [Rhizomicrobium sp.]